MHRAAFNPNMLLLIAGLVLLGAVATFAGYYSGGSSANETTTAPTLPGGVTDSIRGVVQSTTAGSLTLQTEAGVRTLQVTPDTSIEALRPVDASSIRPGDWLNAGALPHRQTLLVLTGLVVLPDGAYEEPSR